MKNVKKIQDQGGFTYRGFAARPLGSSRGTALVGQIYLVRSQPGADATGGGYYVAPRSAQAKASVKAAGFALDTIGIAVDKRTVMEWVDKLLLPSAPDFELSESNLREEAKAQVLTAIHDAIDGMRDGLREFLVYPEMEGTPDGAAAVAGYMGDWAQGIEVGTIQTPLEMRDQDEFRVVWYCPDGHRNHTAGGESTMRKGDLVAYVGGSWEDCQVCGLAPEASELMRIQRDVHAQLNVRSRRQSNS